MNINTNDIFKNILPFAVILLISYIISSIVYIYLPKLDDRVKEQKNFNIEYKKYNVSYSMKENQKKKAIRQKVKKVQDYKLMSSVDLKAIYAKSNTQGWIIIASKKSSQTFILSVGESFKNYKLKAVYPKYAIFQKGSKEYRLDMMEKKEKLKFSLIKEDSKTLKSDTVENPADGLFNIKRDTLDRYIQTPSKIWSEISIKEKKTKGKIDGFVINSLSSKSIFKKLGLKKSDIIKKVNNIELKSYSDAFKIYKKIDKVDNLIFTIIRNKEQMEIEYEIR
ncbi:MAG: hypothetical protein U9Q33_03205 [Campylobacterota bacterium]|nr:hypothetical protein [Campylobacterota bacterium]